MSVEDMKKAAEILCFLIITLLCACSETPHDARLTEVAALANDEPHKALALLDSIDADSLSEADRHYFDFLTVKASDKAYIVHTSDSLILDVIDYYRGKDLYPEALYYGGRVYSDLGDKPTALEYFHRSLDLLPSDKDPELKRRVLSQTGRLLHSLCLYGEAVSFIEAAIEINRAIRDTTLLVFDLELLGVTFLRAEQYERADSALVESLKLNESQNIPYYIAEANMERAAAKFYSNQIDSALILIRNTPDLVDPMIRNSALGYASTIYLGGGILDTAYMYSHELVSNPDPMHKEIGYQNLLSPELRSFIPRDSLDVYISNYQTILATYYDENENEAALNQQNLYNYRLHELKKAEAEKANRTLKLWITVFAVVIVIMTIAILLLKIKNKNNIIELQASLENINKLKHELAGYNGNPKESAGTKTTDEALPVPVVHKRTESELREQLKNELLALSETGEETQAVPQPILCSAIYKTLKNLIRDNRPIVDERLWEELEQTVLQSSPRFLANLSLLTSGRLTSLDIHTALIVKCGFKPSEMTVLFGRSNGAIISRRETLGFKVLDRKISVKTIDRIIRLL